MPTMSLQELAEIETADAMRRGETEAAEEAERQRKAEDSEEDEEELRKQRAFDDFKDDNPRGWGNSRTRPCGC